MNNKLIFEIIGNNLEFQKNSNFGIETIYIKQSLFNIFKIIKKIFSNKYIKNYEYIIIKSNKLHFLSFELLNNLIDEMGSKYLIAIRHSNIYVNNPKHSPRLPYIDPHIYIINTKHNRFNELIETVKYKEPNNINDNFQRLINFIEFNFFKSEVLNLFKDETYNEFGDRKKYVDPYPFSLCKKTGVLILYQEYSNNLLKIFNKVKSAETNANVNVNVNQIFINKNIFIKIFKILLNKLFYSIFTRVTNTKQFSEIKNKIEKL